MILSLAACSSRHKDEPQLVDAPITFRNFDSGLARSASPLEQTSDNFYVVATKTMPGDDNPVSVMPGYRVDHDGAAWNYENGLLGQYLKYWDPMASAYLFSAVAPTPNPDPGASEGYRFTTVNITPDGEISINNVRGNISTGQYTNSSNAPEWVIAQTRRTVAPLADVDLIEPATDLHDPSSPLAALTDPLPLCFHHVMAKVDFSAWATSSIILQSLRIEVADNQEIMSLANFSTSTGWTDLSAPAEHNPLIYCNYTFLDGKTLSDNASYPTLLSSHVQIPQQWADSGRTLNVIFTTTDGVTYSGTITLNATNNFTNSWLKNHHYQYTIKINSGSQEMQVILFAVDMDTWKWKEGNSQEEIQTDW